MRASAFGLVLGAVVALVGAGCGSAPPKKQEIRLGMSKQDLTTMKGEPQERRAPVANGDGKLEEVWLYEMNREVKNARDVTKGVLKSGVGFYEDPTAGRREAFVFVDDKLVRWGPIN